MDINDLTIKQARELAALVNNSALAPLPQQPAAAPPHPFVGKHVICRCHSAGVHAGYLVSQTGDQAVLKDSRRLWSWKTKGGIALSGLAVHGLASGKLDTMLGLIALTGVIETIPTTASAEESINDAP